MQLKNFMQLRKWQSEEEGQNLNLTLQQEE